MSFAVKISQIFLAKAIWWPKKFWPSTVCRWRLVEHGLPSKLFQCRYDHVAIDGERTKVVAKILMHRPFCNQISYKSPTCKLKNGICQRDHCYENFFDFTRGRFVRNERQEMAQRSVRFNMRELGRLAATVMGSEACISIEKYPDGMYNKALLMTMNDGV